MGYDPDKLDEGAEKWILKMCHKYFPSVAHGCEFADLVQDGYTWWFYVAWRYKPQTREHHMSLFMTCYRNHLTDTSRGIRCPWMETAPPGRLEAVPWLSPGDENREYEEERLFGAGDLGETDRVLIEAPPVVRRVLEAVIAGAALPERSLALNAALCDLAGVENVDLKPVLLAYLRR